MPSGTQVWNNQSQLVFDTGTQTVKFFGYLVIPASSVSGSITDGRFTAYGGHRPFACRTDGELPTPLDFIVSISGNTLSWTRQLSADGHSPVSNTFVYGVAAM